jgi:hypothetical protein
MSRETRRQEWKDWKRGNGSVDVSLKNLKKKTRSSKKKKAEENFSSALLSCPGRGLAEADYCSGVSVPAQPDILALV